MSTNTPIFAIDVIRSFQGDRSQNEYAAFLGLTSGGLSLILGGKRGANPTLLRLMSRYPERRAEIAKALVTPETAVPSATEALSVANEPAPPGTMKERDSMSTHTPTFAVGDQVTLHAVIEEISTHIPSGLPYCWVRIGDEGGWFPAAALMPAPPPVAPGWCWLPKRRTALNLAHVSRVEFADAFGMVYLDHAEYDDADAPGFVTTAVFRAHGADVAAIRAALGLPAEGEDTDG